MKDLSRISIIIGGDIIFVIHSELHDLVTHPTPPFFFLVYKVVGALWHFLMLNQKME